MMSRVFIWSIIFVSMWGISAGAAEQIKSDSDSLSFTSQCPQFLKEADDFGRECTKKVREQVRYFHPMLLNGLFGEGEKEVHRIYFKEALPGSHFSLGCSINGDDPKISFLGVYYATDSSYFKAGNEAPIRYTTFMNEAGFWIDKKPVNLVPVREFDTKDFPRVEWKSNRIKNCESPIRPNNIVETLNDHIGIAGGKYEKNGNVSLTLCFGTDCKTHEYVDVFPTKNHEFLWNAVDRRIVTSGGDLLIEKDFFEKSCWPMEQRFLDTPNIAQEVCTKLQIQN